MPGLYAKNDFVNMSIFIIRKKSDDNLKCSYLCVGWSADVSSLRITIQIDVLRLIHFKLYLFRSTSPVMVECVSQWMRFWDREPCPDASFISMQNIAYVNIPCILKAHFIGFQRRLPRNTARESPCVPPRNVAESFGLCFSFSGVAFCPPFKGPGPTKGFSFGGARLDSPPSWGRLTATCSRQVIEGDSEAALRSMIPAASVKRAQNSFTSVLNDTDSDIRRCVSFH